jgi:hypothetical protein
MSAILIIVFMQRTIRQMPAANRVDRVQHVRQNHFNAQFDGIPHDTMNCQKMKGTALKMKLGVKSNI